MGRRRGARRPWRARPAGRGAARRQGPLRHRGRALAGRLEDPRGLPPAVHGDGGPAARRGGRSAAGQDQPGRVRDGLVERELRLRAGPQPLGPQPRPRRLERRQRRGRRGRQRAVGAGDGHRRLDPPARRAVRDRRAQADVWNRQPLRDDRVRLLAGPGGSADPRRHGRRAALPPHDRRRRARLDVAPASRGDRAADRAAPRRDPPRRPGRADRRGHRAGRVRPLRGDARDGPRAGRDDRAGATAARRLRPERLLRAGARGGLVEPRALRRRALRDARHGGAGPPVDVHAHPARRLRPGGQAPHHARHVRAELRLLRRVLRQRPARPHAHRARLHAGVRAGRLRRDADLADRRVRPGRAHRRPAGDVPQRLLHRPDVARRHPGDVDPRGLSDGLPVGFQLAAPAFAENRLLDAALRAGAGDRVLRGPWQQEVAA